MLLSVHLPHCPHIETLLYESSSADALVRAVGIGWHSGAHVLSRSVFVKYAIDFSGWPTEILISFSVLSTGQGET